METLVSRVISVTQDQMTIVVQVGFYPENVDELLGVQHYILKSDETLDDIKPQIKDDLAEFQATRQKAGQLAGLASEVIDLAQTVSVKEKIEIAKQEAIAASE